MKDFLMTSTIPYWIVFALIASAGVLELLNLNKEKVEEKTARTITILAMSGTLLGIAIYSFIGTKCIWWCTSSEYGFFSKLLRAIPLFIFLVVQLAQVFVYQRVMELCWQKELYLKTSFIAIIAIVPIGLIIQIGLSIFGMELATRNLIFYIVMIGGLVIGVGWAMAKNVKSVGSKNGLIYTAVTFVMILGGLYSLILMLNVIIQLFVQILAVAAPFIIAAWLFRSDLGNAIGKSSPTPHIYYDDAGGAHYTASNRDSANAKIAERKQQQQ